MTTDAFIQDVLQKSFANTTVITIAHRLNTVADYDKIIVMHRGKIVESGAPHELIKREGIFYEMVQHTGKNAESIMAKAQNRYEANSYKKAFSK
jgi:ABC-type multidrug transport system fused ATPase/permease subunit